MVRYKTPYYLCSRIHPGVFAQPHSSAERVKVEQVT